MSSLSKTNKDNWEVRSANYKSNIKSVLYKSFPDSLNNHIHIWHKNIILENIPDKNNLKILDLGCGYGRNSLSLIERNKNIEITGIDISENFIELFIENTNQNGIAYSLEEIPENIGKFDYIICIDVLMYVEKINVENVFKNLLSHLKSDGKIILIEPLASGQFFLNGFGIFNRYNAKREATGGNSFIAKDLKKIIENTEGFIANEKRMPITTIFIIPLYILSSLFNNKVMEIVFKLVDKLDYWLSKAKLPSINISLVIQQKVS